MFFTSWLQTYLHTIRKNPRYLTKRKSCHFAPAAEILEDRTLLSTLLGEVEPNDTVGTANPVPLGFDAGEDFAVDISGTLTNSDADVFAVDLVAGDIFGANLSGDGTHLTFRDPSGTELIGSGQDRSSFYPAVSPLPGGGNAVLSWVVDTAGTYTVAVDDGDGAYTANLRVFRPVLESQQRGNHQILFLDFDGETINAQTTCLCGFGNSVANLSPLSGFLTDCGSWVPATKTL